MLKIITVREEFTPRSFRVGEVAGEIMGNTTGVRTSSTTLTAREVGKGFAWHE